MTKLLPCPFCGGEGMVKGIVEDSSGGGSNYVECTDCEVSTPLFYSCGEDAIPRAVECWNHRAAPTPQPVAPQEVAQPADDLVAEVSAAEWTRRLYRVADNCGMVHFDHKTIVDAAARIEADAERIRNWERDNAMCDHELGRQQLRAERAEAALAAAQEDRDELLRELASIARADPTKWEPDMRDQFQEWAQNRARNAVAARKGTTT